jgi:hypothetical protein
LRCSKSFTSDHDQPSLRAEQITLKVVCGGWTLSRVNPASKDDRTLGVLLSELTMRAKGAGERVFQANTGEWKQPQRLHVGGFPDVAFLVLHLP